MSTDRRISIASGARGDCVDVLAHRRCLLEGVARQRGRRLEASGVNRKHTQITATAAQLVNTWVIFSLIICWLVAWSTGLPLGALQSLSVNDLHRLRMAMLCV